MPPIKDWETLWAEYQEEYPVENMSPGEQYTVKCRDFKQYLKQQILFLRRAELDHKSDILYMTNIQHLLEQIINVAKRMNREDSDHAAVINRGVDHWDREFERLCYDRIMHPLQQAFLVLYHGKNQGLPPKEVDYRVARMLQGVFAIANVLLSDDGLPQGFGYIAYGFPPDYERLSDVLPGDFGVDDIEDSVSI